MKKLPVGIQTFRDVIEEGYLYVDKTPKIYDLLSGGGKYFFLSRPRRFGKSLLISTLEELFSGNKELFHNLWIYDKIPWEKYPVITLDFTEISYHTPERFRESLTQWVRNRTENMGLEPPKGEDCKQIFLELVKKLALKANKKVVILIDEYDKPIIDNVNNNKIADANRRILAEFYSVIKTADRHIKFAFLTGVSKFSRVSVFSGLNNLRDITLSRSFSTLLGYTVEELRCYFGPYIKRMAGDLQITESRLMDDIRQWYNGYSWDGEEFLYNPFSILSLFTEGSFDNFWFSTGSPGFLIHLIKERRVDVREFENLPVKNQTFDGYEPDNIDISSLLFQTGYLTVKKITVKNNKKTYHLSYPNQEVRDSFFMNLLRDYTKQDLSLGTRIVDRIVDAVGADDMEKFVEELKALFASIPYPIFVGTREAYYHTVVYLVLKLAGARVGVEDQTNRGRIDAVLETGTNIYVMEFKMGSAREALEQIKRLDYHRKYLTCGKNVTLIGIGFDAQNRNIGDYIAEKAL